jgi:hypothetical protein
VDRSLMRLTERERERERERAQRFAAGLATRPAHHSGPRRLAIPFLAEDLHLLFFRQRDWRTQVWVTNIDFAMSATTSAASSTAKSRPICRWCSRPSSNW